MPSKQGTYLRIPRDDNHFLGPIRLDRAYHTFTMVLPAGNCIPRSNGCIVISSFLPIGAIGAAKARSIIEERSKGSAKTAPA